MIDARVYVGLETDSWRLDIDIVDGEAVLLPDPQEETTRQQRKAILAYQAINTIPGDWDRGVNWGKIFNSPQMSMADAMMDVQVALSRDEGESAANAYSIPIIQQTEEGSMVQLLTVSTDDMKNITLGA